jgi:DNA-binding NtrC family response regulator
MGRELKILLVDDEEIVHLTLGDYLIDCGYQVDKAVDGVQALRAIDRMAHDLVIADVGMPGLDGLTLLARVRERDSQLPVIMITGHGDVDMQDQAEGMGATGFLLKPIKLRELDELIRDLVGGVESCNC